MIDAIYNSKKGDEVLLDGSEVEESDYNSRANSNMGKSNRYTEVDNNILLNPVEGYDQNLENENNNNTNNDNNQNSNNNTSSKKKTLRKPMVEKYKFKIILLGEKEVGKSSLISRYVDNKFEKDGNVSEIRNKNVELDESTRANISIYDTTTQEKLQKFTKDYYRDTHGALIVFDLYNIQSFEKVKFWIDELKSNGPKDAIFAIIGNKSDITDGQRVKFENALAVAGDNLYYEVSAKSGNNVSLAFEQLVYGIIEKQADEENNPDKVLRGKDGRKSVDLKDFRAPRVKKGCC